MVIDSGATVGGLIDDAWRSGPAGGAGLDLVVGTINEVIATIQVEQDKLQPVGFAFGALVHPSAFGGSDSAPDLGLHYSRAHEVIWKTLEGIKQDLVGFQQACENAMSEIEKADDEAVSRAHSLERATESIAAGAAGSQSVDVHRNAQQNQNVHRSRG